MGAYMGAYIGFVLQISLIVLILALIIFAVLGILVLLDVRFITNRLRKEIKAASFLLGIMDFIIAGVEIAKKKIGETGLAKIIGRFVENTKEEDK